MDWRLLWLVLPGGALILAVAQGIRTYRAHRQLTAPVSPTHPSRKRLYE